MIIIFYIPELIEFIEEDWIPSAIPTVGGNDSPSGVGRGPEGMAWNIGLFSTFSSSRGSPNPALAQLTFDRTFLSSSKKRKYQSHLEYYPLFSVLFMPRNW